MTSPSTSSVTHLLASDTNSGTMHGVRRYPISFLLMLFALAAGTALSAALKQESWMYMPAAVLLVAALVYAALRARAANDTPAE